MYGRNRRSANRAAGVRFNIEPILRFLREIFGNDISFYCHAHVLAALKTDSGLRLLQFSIVKYIFAEGKPAYRRGMDPIFL